MYVLYVEANICARETDWVPDLSVTLYKNVGFALDKTTDNKT